MGESIDHVVLQMVKSSSYPCEPKDVLPHSERQKARTQHRTTVKMMMIVRANFSRIERFPILLGSFQDLVPDGVKNPLVPSGAILGEPFFGLIDFLTRIGVFGFFFFGSSASSFPICHLFFPLFKGFVGVIGAGGGVAGGAAVGLLTAFSFFFFEGILLINRKRSRSNSQSVS